MRGHIELNNLTSFSAGKKKWSRHWINISSNIFNADEVTVSVAQVCPILCDPMDCLLCPWNFPGKNTGVGCHSLLQGIFLTQGLNPGLLHCRQTPYHLRHQGSSLMLIVMLINFLKLISVKGLNVVHEAMSFLEFSFFFYDPTDVGDLISGSSAISKSSLNI